LTVDTFEGILECGLYAGDAIDCMARNPLTAKTHRLILTLLVLWSFFLLPVWSRARAQEEEPTPLDPAIEQLLAQMTPEEKVGQLFLVTFVGGDASPVSDVARLIQVYRVGGVALSTDNGNFVNNDVAPQLVATLTNELQELAFTSPLTSTLTPTATTFTPIPLFIALNQEGDGHPFTDLWAGLTPLPNEMAIGATWNSTYAQQVGQIVGEELTAIGVNMLLGPSLDVLDRPRPALPGSLGSRTFGGDPYWVGRLGQAYIQGVHEGSNGRLLTVAKHFPGLGDTDRNPYEELPTIQKSLETLRSIELVPFFAATTLNPDTPSSATDALMTSHVRYRGFQGNIRQLTRPISCDAQNLPAILSLPEFAPWREAGGLLVSDALGVPAIRKFYDPTLETFPAKRIAQECFLAGNDLLYLAQFDLTDDWRSQLANIEATFLFFRDKYNSDPAFRARVDESVARILQHKRAIYGDFTLEGTQVSLEQIPELVGQQRSAISQVAPEAATLIYPGLDELSDRLPGPPLSDDQILIISDDRQGRDCARCLPFYFISPTGLESRILQLYGPDATGQISPDQVDSLTFSQIKEVLSGEVTGEAGDIGEPVETGEISGVTEEAGSQVDDLIRAADWLIFASLDVNTLEYPQSDALKLFLRERSESLQGKKLVVLAFNAPYYLDTTEVSKLTAYYGLYSKTPSFLDAAVRLLFQEFQPRGSSPVAVDAIDYQIVEVTRPDPNQVINIEVVTDQATVPSTVAPNTTPAPQGSPEETPIPIQLDLLVGDVLALRTGKIVDWNGRPVPDGTPVEFRFLDPISSLEAPRLLATTVDGVASTDFTLDRSGTWEITATSDTAQRSVRLILTIPEEGPVEVGVDRPTPTATPTSTSTPTPTSTSTPTATATQVPPPTPTSTSTPTPEPTPEPVPPGKTVDAMGLFLSLVTLSLVGGVSYVLPTGHSVALEERLRRLLTAIVSGLVGYILFGTGLLPLEKVPVIAGAIQAWLPYEVLPVLVSLVFAGIGLLLVELVVGIMGARHSSR
jgi:beta-N-acetylhexosaminidase